MNKKGFTLVELLAAIALLAVIAMVSITTVVSFFKKGKEELYQDQLQNIKLAAKAWTSDNKDKINENGCYILKLEELQNQNYIDNKIKDPRSDELLNADNIAVKITLDSNNKHQYVVYDDYDETKVFCEIQNDAENGNNYEVGYKFILSNDEYYIISSQDKYVTVLKAEPLTVAEVNEYGGVGTENNHVNKYTPSNVGTSSNRNGYGEMSYYSSENCGYINDSWVTSGCTTDYAQSEVKYVVDAWASTKFVNGELATDSNGYTARLITKTELDTLGCTSNNCINSTYNWLYNSNYWYWTMSPYELSTGVRYIKFDGSINTDLIGGVYSLRSVRPVINIKKSVLDSIGGNNNE